MAIKNDYIKIRVSKEQKELFKDIAKKKKVSMSEFMIVATEERALREKEKFEGTKSLELRVSELEKKLQDIKLKMDRKRLKKKGFKRLKNIIIFFVDSIITLDDNRISKQKSNFIE